MKLNGLFLILILAEKALPDLFVRHKDSVKSIDEQWYGQYYSQGSVNRNKVSSEYEDRKTEIEKDHHRAEDGEHLIIHFAGTAHDI
jgi:hypothetical protein